MACSRPTATLQTSSPVVQQTLVAVTSTGSSVLNSVTSLWTSVVTSTSMTTIWQPQQQILYGPCASSPLPTQALPAASTPSSPPASVQTLTQTMLATQTQTELRSAVLSQSLPSTPSSTRASGFVLVPLGSASHKVETLVVSGSTVSIYLDANGSTLSLTTDASGATAIISPGQSADSAPGPEDGASIGMIAGIAAGASIVFLAIVLLVWRCLARKRERQERAHTAQMGQSRQDGDNETLDISNHRRQSITDQYGALASSSWSTFGPNNQSSTSLGHGLAPSSASSYAPSSQGDTYRSGSSERRRWLSSGRLGSFAKASSESRPSTPSTVRSLKKVDKASIGGPTDFVHVSAGDTALVDRFSTHPDEFLPSSRDDLHESLALEELVITAQPHQFNQQDAFRSQSATPVSVTPTDTWQDYRSPSAASQNTLKTGEWREDLRAKSPASSTMTRLNDFEWLEIP